MPYTGDLDQDARRIPEYFGENRYNSLNLYYQRFFGVKVYRIAIDAGFTCPNRDGSKGRGGCSYCDPKGSGAGYIQPDFSVQQQIEHGINFSKRRYKATHFIAYFQAFSNTYAPVETLRKLYQPVLQAPDIVGLALGTRPDTISPDKLDFLHKISQKKPLWIEYGLESAHDRTLSSG